MMLINGHLTVMQLRNTSHDLMYWFVISYTCTPLFREKQKPVLVYW